MNNFQLGGNSHTSLSIGNNNTILLWHIIIVIIHYSVINNPLSIATAAANLKLYFSTGIFTFAKQLN